MPNRRIAYEFRSQKTPIALAFLGALGLDFFGLLSWIFGVIAAATLLGYTIVGSPPYVIGENLVSIEVNFPGGFLMKPITIFVYSFFLSFIFGLNSSRARQRFLSMRPSRFTAIYLVAWFFAAASGFEIVYHLVIWSAALSVQGFQNPDIIVNTWPQSIYPINVVFSAKIVILIFAASCYLIDHVKRIERLRIRIERQEPLAKL